MTVSTGTLNERLKSNSLCTDPPPPSLPSERIGEVDDFSLPDFFSEGIGGGGGRERLYTGKNQTTIGLTNLRVWPSGSYSNTVLRKDLIPGPSLQKLLCCFCSYMDPLMQCGIGADEVVHKKWCLDLLKSAKLRWFKVQKFRKTKLAQRKNKINVLWKRHVIR